MINPWFYFQGKTAGTTYSTIDDVVYSLFATHNNVVNMGQYSFRRLILHGTVCDVDVASATLIDEVFECQGLCDGTDSAASKKY